MGIEIERKFFLDHRAFLLAYAAADDDAKTTATIEQAYLSEDPVVRVRIVTSKRAPAAYLTIKGKGLISRAEFEYEIPMDDARAMMRDFKGPRLTKTRRTLLVGDHAWEVDEFHNLWTEWIEDLREYTDLSEGLWIAEIELGSEEELFTRPDWLEEEVTHEGAMLSNVNLARFSESR